MANLLSRRALLKSATALAALRQIGCIAETGSAMADPSAAAGAAVPAALDYDAFACDATPTAYLSPGASADQHGRATRLLEAAGFRVEPLPGDRSPAELHGLILIPSLVSDSAVYRDYVERYAADLYEFVDGANVLVQLPQAQDSEPVPPFLPMTHAASRGEAAVSAVAVASPEHALLRSIATVDGKVAWTLPSGSAPVFVSQDGFEVLLSDESNRHALLLEGAYGQGRFILSALAFDAELSDAEQAKLVASLFANLFEHVQAVCSRAAAAVSLAPSTPSATFSPGSSMLAVLPDTQVYSLRMPGLYNAQTTWIRQNTELLDIRYVIHLGDIVNNNTRLEWERASASMALLHGVVPYALVPGNHDYGPSGDASTRGTYMNEYFSFELSAAMPSFGAAYEEGKLDSSYHLFSVQGREFILIALEWGPRDEVVDWANEIMRAYPEREGILVTHAYLNNNDRRYDHTDKKHSQRFNPHEYATPGAMNDGEQLWQKLVRNHRFAMTLNGHVLGDGCGYLASVTDRGNTCHQMLSNYQMREMGGEAYMRLLEFLDDGRTVRVFTYSPLYDKFLDEPGHNFTITLD